MFLTLELNTFLVSVRAGAAGRRHLDPLVAVRPGLDRGGNSQERRSAPLHRARALHRGRLQGLLLRPGQPGSVLSHRRLHPPGYSHPLWRVPVPQVPADIRQRDGRRRTREPRHDRTIRRDVMLSGSRSTAQPRPRGSRASDSGKRLDRGAATGEEILAVPLDSDIYAANPRRVSRPAHRGRSRRRRSRTCWSRSARSGPYQVREPCASKVVSLHVDEGKGLEIVVALDEKAPSAGGRRSKPRWPTMNIASASMARRPARTGPPSSSDGVIFDYSRFMDVRNRDVVIPANEYRQFKLVVEQELDDRESPLRELIRGRRRQDGKKDTASRSPGIRARPSASTGRPVADRRDGGRERGRDLSVPRRGFRVEHDAKEKVSRVEIQSRREPLTRFSLATSSRNFSRNGPGPGSGRARRAHRLGRGRPWHGCDYPVPRIPPRRAAGRISRNSGRSITSS